MSDITAKFTLTGADYEAYLRYYYAHTRKGRHQMRRMYFVGMILYVWFMVMEYDHPKFGIGHPGSYAAYAIITGALLGGGFWYFLNRIWPTLAQGAVRRSAQKDMFTETEITIREHSLLIRTEKGKGELTWPHVTAVAENADYVFLLTGGINAFIIPKRGFDGDAVEAMEQIREFTDK